MSATQTIRETNLAENQADTAQLNPVAVKQHEIKGACAVKPPMSKMQSSFASFANSIDFDLLRCGR